MKPERCMRGIQVASFECSIRLQCTPRIKALQHIEQKQGGPGFDIEDMAFVYAICFSKAGEQAPNFIIPPISVGLVGRRDCSLSRRV
jgi:hypothetical protein